MRYSREAMFFGLAVVFTGLTCLAGPRLAEAGGMGVGMMGPGMMGSPGSPEEASPGQVNPTRAKALLGYIHEHNPACLQCYVVSGASFGPSFESIATSYSSRADAENLLAMHIAHGFGRMPPGLASDAQATQLARLILNLSATSRP
jgi:cytochrome c551/c552